MIDAAVGIALSPADGATSSEKLMRNADLALYRAKEDGRRTHRFFERGMDRQAQMHRDIELDRRRALAKDEFECTTSRWSTSRPIGSAALNRCCAGDIPTGA